MAAAPTMRAVRYTRTGGPEVLQVAEMHEFNFNSFV